MTTKGQLTPQNSSSSGIGLHQIGANNVSTPVQQHYTSGKYNSQISNLSFDLNKTMIKGPDTFIIVKFGNNQDVIFNTNCKLKFLLDNLKQRCKIYEKDRVIDLCDIDGNLINIREDVLQTRYATTVFRPRQSCVLIEIKRSEEDKTLRFIPLLDNRDIINDIFLANLSPKNIVKGAKRNSKLVSKSTSNPVPASSNSNTNGNSGSDAIKTGSNKPRSMSIVPQQDKLGRRKSIKK